jgi:hypothetical protein
LKLLKWQGLAPEMLSCGWNLDQRAEAASD